jgi:hypothetical protein
MEPPCAVAERKPRDGGAPFVVRLVAGDIIDAQASMIVVSHFNDVPPAGAERAVDAVLGGVITHRAATGALRGRFATTHLLPAVTSPLATTCVCIVCLGDPERFTKARLPEIGAAIVDAAATIGARDAATILHGAGLLEVEPDDAAAQLMSGVLASAERFGRGAGLRELWIVERDAARLANARSGVDEAISRSSRRGKVHVEEAQIPSRVQVVGDGPGVLPGHVRLGITRAGEDLKVTIISQDQPYDCVARVKYPGEVALEVAERLRKDLLGQGEPGARTRAMQEVGGRLYEAFLSDPNVEVAARIAEAPGDLIVLRLDDVTADVPWELLRIDGRFVTREKVVSRQVELETIGRQSAYAAPHEQLEVLVIGDPTGELPGARREARAVAAMLDDRAAARVTQLVGDEGRTIGYQEVCEALNSSDFDVLHYAGHADYDGLHEERSGFVLADRMLTASDLTSRTSLPRVVVANACSSAKTGDPGVTEAFDAAERTRDMVGALLRGGVRAFLGTQWPVDDAAAETFALALYGSLLTVEGGRHTTIGEAVRRARCAVVEQHGESSTDWAAYALYGSPWRPAL